MIKKWEELPHYMRTKEVKPYYDYLYGMRFSIAIKRVIDFILACVILLLLLLPMVIIAAIIKIDSPGPVFYRQERVTRYGKHFWIHKFRSMRQGADREGSAVTVNNDCRITKAGHFLRKTKLDELPQLIDVIKGDMSFVGTRPEAVKYVESYEPEYYSTLLMPAGITSEASIYYKDENSMLESADNVDKVYVEEILPEKMRWNLISLKKFTIMNDIRTMFKTIGAVAGIV